MNPPNCDRQTTHAQVEQMTTSNLGYANALYRLAEAVANETQSEATSTKAMLTSCLFFDRPQCDGGCRDVGEQEEHPNQERRFCVQTDNDKSIKHFAIRTHLSKSSRLFVSLVLLPNTIARTVPVNHNAMKTDREKQLAEPDKIKNVSNTSRRDSFSFRKHGAISMLI